MIEINLLPPERRKKKEAAFTGLDLASLNLEAFPTVKIAAGAFIALVTIQILLFLIGVYGKFYASNVRAGYERLLPQKKEADALRAETEAINRKIAAIDDLMVNRFSWARELSALNESMTPGIWLTELSYDERVVERPVSPEARVAPLKEKLAAAPGRSGTEKMLGRFLVLSGYACGPGEQGTALVGKFIKSLKDNAQFYSAFSDIELGAIRRDRIEDQEVMNFRITCLFKEKA